MTNLGEMTTMKVKELQVEKDFYELFIKTNIKILLGTPFKWAILSLINNKKIKEATIGEMSTSSSKSIDDDLSNTLISMPGENLGIKYALAMAYPKTETTKRFLVRVLRTSTLGQTLDWQTLNELADVMIPIEFEAEDHVVVEGRINNYLYVVNTGVLVQSSTGQQTETLHRGSIFGKLYMLYATTSNTSVKAVTNGTLWAIKSNAYWSKVFWSKLLQRCARINLLRNNRFFKNLSNKEYHYLADRLCMKSYRKGFFIFRQGQASTGIYFVQQGQVILLENDIWGNPHLFIQNIGPKGCFGVTALTSIHPRRYSAVASKNTITYYIATETFKNFLGFSFNRLKINYEYERELQEETGSDSSAE